MRCHGGDDRACLDCEWRSCDPAEDARQDRGCEEKVRPRQEGRDYNGRPTTPRKPGTATKTASSRGKKAPAKRVTWRNRQMSPSPDRYREIQGALAAKGFLSPEDATGTWNQTSSDALKKFQAEQNLESSGKINSLSLIALGLGPKRDPSPAAPKPPLIPPGQ